MINLHPIEFWFVTGSQHLYGPKALDQVAQDSKKMVEALNGAGTFPAKLIFKPVVTSAEQIRAVCQEANASAGCGGVILWMHTFSPSKMWIGGLSILNKPFAHLHTQFNRDLPWGEIDMDFMNLNQSAHGDREAGFIHTRLRLGRKVVVGHWSEKEVQKSLGTWMRAARAWHDLQGAKFARFGDNMREVAVTEGDKVAAEARFGMSVNGYGLGDVAKDVQEIGDAAIDKLCKEYEAKYEVVADLKKGGSRHDSLRDGARIELGMRRFLERGNFNGFTTTFEDLYGLNQLPGMAAQRLMADGYGFGAEGDWKTSVLLRAMKVMAADLPGGTSFMEDYTYHLEAGNYLVLGAHMLEVCESIAAGKPSLQIHALGIGGKADPVRLVFDAHPGEAINASLVDLGNRFRLIVNEVKVVAPPQALPKLPVARAVWKCKPDFKTAAGGWIYAGGAHHTGFSYPVTAEHMDDFATIAGIEMVLIDDTTTLPGLKQNLRNNEVYYHLSQGIGRREAGWEEEPGRRSTSEPGVGGMNMSYEELKERVYRANLALVEAGLVTLTWGNASGVDRKAGVMAIKPSGVAYSDLQPKSIVILSLENGQTIEGNHRPSSDTPTHLHLYQSFTVIGGVVHTHSAAATSFAQACRDIPCFGTTHADNFYGTIPVTAEMTAEEIRTDYELNTGKVIVDCFQKRKIDPKNVPGVLVASHAPFAWGDTLDKAVENAIVLEFTARMALDSLALNPALSPISQSLLDKHFFRKHGPGAYYGQK